MAAVICEGRAEPVPELPVTGEDRLDGRDPRRPCGQHYRMLVFRVRRSGIVDACMNPCGDSPLLHPLFMLYYGKGVSGVRLAISDCMGSDASTSFYATGQELYTAVFTSYLPGEVGGFNFCIKERE